MVLEFRRDWLKDGLVVVADERSKRPRVKKKGCPFCKGNEFTTPPTTLALPSEKEWRVRAFENAFPALKRRGRFSWKKDRAPSFGDHEVIVDTHQHNALFQDLSREQLRLVFQAYQHRLVDLESRKQVKSVFLFKNHGPRSGASIVHEHAQIVSFPFVYEQLEAELKNFKQGGRCVFCRPAGLGKKLAENKHFIAVVPELARFPCESWLVAKKHVSSIAKLGEEDGVALLELLQEVVRRAYGFCDSYNVAFHSAPPGKDFHFHAEVYPRKPTWGAIELGAGPVLNVVSENNALKVLKA